MRAGPTAQHYWGGAACLARAIKHGEHPGQWVPRLQLRRSAHATVKFLEERMACERANAWLVDMPCTVPARAGNPGISRTAIVFRSCVA